MWGLLKWSGMKHFYIRIALPLITLFAFFILASTIAAGKDYFSSSEPYVRLATLWDAPGVVETISPDSSLLVIYDEAADKSRLVELTTGNVRLVRTGENSIRFSPYGRYVAAYNEATRTVEIIGAADGQVVAELPGGRVVFSRDGSLAAGISRSETSGYSTMLIEIATGQILGLYDGYSSGFSPDSTLLAVVDPENAIVHVYHARTGALAAEIAAPPLVEERHPSISAEFPPVGGGLAVYQRRIGITQFFDTDTWCIRFEAPRHMDFNRDGSFLVAGNEVEATTVRLVHVATGEVVNQVFGWMRFSDDGRFVFRFENIVDDISKVQVIDLATGEVRAEQIGFLAVALKANNRVLQMFDNQTRNTRFIDLARGIPVEIEGHANLYTLERNLLLYDGSFTSSSTAYLADFESGEVYISARDIQISLSGQYIFALDGNLVDVYGLPSARLNTMPAPRQ